MTVVSRAAIAAPLNVQTPGETSDSRRSEAGALPFRRSAGDAGNGRVMRADKMDSPGGLYETREPADYAIQAKGMQLRQLFRTTDPGGGDQFMQIKPNITVHGHPDDFYVVDPDVTLRITKSGASIVRAPAAGFAPIPSSLHAMINMDRVGHHLQQRGFTSNVRFELPNPNFSPSPASSGHGSGANSPVSWV